MSERIAAAAVMFRGSPVQLPPPARHHDIIKQISNGVPETEWPVCGSKDQGFMTNLGRFVGRREARQIAESQNQLIQCEGESAIRVSRRLFSEDVW
jgi:hypothetical protein